MFHYPNWTKKALIKKKQEMNEAMERLDMKIDKFSKILEKKAWLKPNFNL